MIEFRGMYETLDHLAFSPDGRSIAACSDKHLYCWDATGTGHSNRREPPAGRYSFFLLGFAFSSDGRALTIAGRYRAFHRISLVDGTITSHNFDGWWSHAAFSPRDPILILAANIVEARSIIDGTVLWSAPPDRFPRISAICFSPSGDQLLCFHADEVSFLDPLTGELLLKHPFPQIPSNVRVSISPNMAQLVLQSGNNTEIFDFEKRSHVTTLNTGRRFFTDHTFDPHSQFLATTSNDRTVRLWDTATWAEVATFTWDIGKMRSVCFAPDALRMAASSDTGRVVVWDVED